MCLLRSALRRLYGRGGYRAPAARTSFGMRLLGAEVRSVTSGTATLKDAMNEALRDWVVECRGHVLYHRHGRRSAPLSGDGARVPVGDRASRTRCAIRSWTPKAGCPTRWSPASAAGPTRSGCFHPFLDEPDIEIIGVEAAGLGHRYRQTRGLDHRRAARVSCMATGPICCKTMTARSQDAHSISAGLDYPGIGPEHAWLHDLGRVNTLLYQRHR